MLLYILIGLVYLLIYTLLHEGAHGVSAVIFGGKLTNFNINFLSGSPHISYTGDLALWKKAIVSIAGPMVPFIIWLIAILKVKKTNNMIINKIILLVSVFTLFTLIPNIILPLLYEAGANVQGEDIIKFIIYSGMNSYLVSVIIAILFYTGCWVLYKKVDIKETLMYKLEMNINSRIHKIGIGCIAIISTILIVMTTLNLGNILITSSSYQVPKEYDKLIDLKLSEANYENSDIYEFEVKEPKMYSFYILGQSRESISLKLESQSYINGTRSNEITFVNGPGKMQGVWTGWYIEEGKYSIKLSSSYNQGQLKIYIQSDEPSKDMDKYLNSRMFSGQIPELENGYELVFNEGLGSFDEKNIYEFAIDNDKNVVFSIFLTSKKGKATVKLLGRETEDILISEYQVFTEGRGAFLKKGKYNITLTSEDCDGEIYVFIKQ